MLNLTPTPVTALAVLTAWALNAGVCLADFTTKSETIAPPEQVSPAVKAVLGESCHQVLKDGKPLFEFWLSREIPLKEAPATVEAGLDTMATAALIGVVRIHKELRDYRDDELYKGVFTMRFGKIPADGNHLGATEYPYFAVLIPAKEDTELDGIKTYKKMTRASSKDTASEHPIIMSLRPIKKRPITIPTLTTPVDEHHCLVVSAKGRPLGADKDAELVFEVVVEGFGEI